MKEINNEQLYADILSVKRSDGEIFKIGDIVGGISYGKENPVKITSLNQFLNPNKIPESVTYINWADEGILINDAYIIKKRKTA